MKQRDAHAPFQCPIEFSTKTTLICGMARKTITSKDVARLAKVSQSAVSRTFTHGASVSQDIRARVLEAAQDIGYRPNALARAMISKKSGLIAVLVTYLDNHFYPPMLEQLSRSLQTHGYQVLLFITDIGHQDRVVKQMLQYQVEGIVMASASLSSGLAEECVKTGTPVILFNRIAPASPASSVTSDNFEGARQVAHFLAQGGHRRIAFVAGAADSSTGRDREAGLMAGLCDEGLALFARAPGEYTFANAAQAARNLFGGSEKPDALFVANDHMAFAVMDVLRGEMGLKVPQDVSVVGYDDVPEADWQGYALTTVAQPRGEMVEATVAMLMQQIEDRNMEKRAVVFPPKLILRSSARLPPAEEALHAGQHINVHLQ